METPTSSSSPAATTPTPEFKRAATSVPLGSSFMDWASLPQRTTAAGVIRQLFDAPAPTLERLELHVTTLNPGATTHAPHTHPWEEVLIVKEGEIEVSINGQLKTASEGAVIFFASNDAHAVANRSSQPATYYVINFFAEAARTVRPEAAATWLPAGQLGSTVMNWADGETKEMTHDSRRTFFGGQTATFTNLKIHATTVPAGRYPVRHGGHLNILLVIVKEGMVESTLDTVTHPVGPGCFILLAPHAIQTIRNRGTVPATYYVLSVSTAETPR